MRDFHRLCKCGMAIETQSGYCRDCHAANMRAWRKANPPTEEQAIRNRARAYAGVYARRGKLEPKPCEVCGTTENIQRHHDDYSKPLEVRYFCAVHHRIFHALNPAIPA